MTSLCLRNIENALDQAGCGYTRKGDSIQAQCPAHEDQNPSLSVRENGEGTIGVHCHAGCSTKDVLGELDLTFKDLYPDDASNNSANKNHIQAEYNYTDKRGTLLYQAVRLEPKGFRQRQPKVGGGWQWNLKGVDPVVYNLPEVIRQRDGDKLIFLVEGEKDAEALISSGLCGTTAPMGAGKWKPAFNRYFEGAEVVILPDNDGPGRKHAAEMAAELVGPAKTLRILQLPGLKDKQDVSDWLANGGTGDKLLELAFESESVPSAGAAKTLLGLDADIDQETSRHDKNLFFEDNLQIYSNDEEERVVADFIIDIVSIVIDDELGKVFYVKITTLARNQRKVSQKIEIKPECLDHKRSFHKVIRPYSMGEILTHPKYSIKPLHLFKWLEENFDKPEVRRPDHLGFIKGNKGRHYWLFGNALVCPPWDGNDGQIVEPNAAGEFIIGPHEGFTLPLYDSNAEKQRLAPTVETDLSQIGVFFGEVKTKLIELIGGGDPTGRARNYGKLLLGYVIYHLYEEELYHANDINGHTVLFYVYGPKGTGKTTYFNTVLRAFFGMHDTESIKGNSVSVPGIENIMSMYSNLPVCYDEFNPEAANISYQHINSYYHKTGRSVSDTDRTNRNKFVKIRSTFSITSNYAINLDIDQADATESRTIYFQYKKAYRSDNQQLFDWMQDNLHRLSAITIHLLLNQTDQKRKQVKTKATGLYAVVKNRLESKFEERPNKYEPEHRLTDNYTRILACYELIFGEDENLRQFIQEELLQRFAEAKRNSSENSLINQMIFLASSGELKEAWQYNYNNSQRELYIDLSQCYQIYVRSRNEGVRSSKQFKKTLKEYFTSCGGYHKWGASAGQVYTKIKTEIRKTLKKSSIPIS